MALFIYVFSLIVSDSSGAGRAPINDSTTLVNEVIVIPIAEHLTNSIGVFERHGELLVVVIARASHASNLLHNSVAIVFAPIPARINKLLTADFKAGDAFFSELFVHLGLGGNTCMVGAKDPTSLITLHASTTDAGVLDGVVQGMAHMKHAGYVRRRNNDGVCVCTVLAETGRRPKYPFSFQASKSGFSQSW